jgi:hypothetical protein
MCLNKTCCKVHPDTHLPDAFPIQNFVKLEDALSPLIFIFTLELAIRKVQESHGLKLNGAHQFLVYAHDINLLAETYPLTPWCRILFEKLIVTQLIKKNISPLSHASHMFYPPHPP